MIQTSDKWLKLETLRALLSNGIHLGVHLSLASASVAHFGIHPSRPPASSSISENASCHPFPFRVMSYACSRIQRQQ